MVLPTVIVIKPNDILNKEILQALKKVLDTKSSLRKIKLTNQRRNFQWKNQHFYSQKYLEKSHSLLKKVVVLHTTELHRVAPHQTD